MSGTIEIAKELGISKSTAHNYLVEMNDHANHILKAYTP